MARRSLYWADAYVEKKLSAKEAIGRIRPGTRVFIGSSCGEPQHLVKALAEASNFFLDIEIMRLLTLETVPLSIIADDSSGRNLNIRSFYLGSAAAANISERRRFITPLNLSAIPRLFKSRGLPIHTALIQVSPPDDFGWMSLGVAVDITLAAAQSADWVIAQVNPRMPRVLGQSFIHVNDVDVVVEHEEELLTIGELPELDTAGQIGRLVASLIEDGSTIDICLGATPHATLMALSEKNDLGIHSQYLTDGMMTLVSKGIITNRRKGFNDGQIVASSAVGTTNFYEFLDDNPSINFYPSDYVNNPGIIARHNRMVSINMAMAIDLTGQVAADALPYNHFSGVTGMVDFMRGAVASKGGKSILMMPSRHFATHQSRIVPQLQDMAVVVPRGDVHHVVTEYGAVNLFGKSLQERAMAMISIAHPDDREALFREAQRQGLLGPERTLRETLQGIYPVQLEEKIEVGGEIVTIRPVKRVDERRLQEHFYNLAEEDIISRFFHLKKRFGRSEMEKIFEIDYVKNLSVVALVGEFGFGRIIGVGEYLLDPSSNMTEVAFTVQRAYQGKGIGRLIIKKLAEAARENGISGFVAYTAPENKKMINLFHSLPYAVKSTFEEGFLVLTSRFDSPKKA
ncbi:MAG: GNAT family N-acetyltransferase [Desulfobacteraceae bacterium]|nr:GNAT family N-acetyltransferase [Desulfobacteraceae bacterium]